MTLDAKEDYGQMAQVCVCVCKMRGQTPVQTSQMIEVWRTQQQGCSGTDVSS